MAEVKIDYEHTKFKIEIIKDGDFYRIKCQENINPLELPLIKNEIKNKKFILDNKEVDFNILIEILQDRDNYTLKDKEIVVLEQENIIKIDDMYSINLLVKNSNGFKEEIIKAIIEKFDDISDFKGHKVFKDFLIKALEEDYEIIENEEFPGTMLKFYKEKKLLKAVYIKDEKIEFVDFTQKYKELQIENIKESLEKLNEKLELEGKKPLNLEFKQ